LFSERFVPLAIQDSASASDASPVISRERIGEGSAAFFLAPNTLLSFPSPFSYAAFSFHGLVR